MRRFSQKEKEYIKRICDARRTEDGVAYYRMELLYEIFEEEDVVLSSIEDPSTGDVIFTCTFGDDTGFPPVAHRLRILHDIYDAALLLNDLENEGYINYVNIKDAKPISLIRLNYGSQTDEQSIPTDIALRLTKEVHCKSMVTQTLFDLVNANFRTYEDQTLEEARQQTRLALDSLEEARQQTHNSNKALEEAKKQTRNNNWILALAIITFLLQTIALVFFR